MIQIDFLVVGRSSVSPVYSLNQLPRRKYLGGCGLRCDEQNESSAPNRKVTPECAMMMELSDFGLITAPQGVQHGRWPFSRKATFQAQSASSNIGRRGVNPAGDQGAPRKVTRNHLPVHGETTSQFRTQISNIEFSSKPSSRLWATESGGPLNWIIPLMWNTYRDAIPGQVQERIRQIETKELRKLRHASRSRKLRAFLDATVRE